MSSFGTCEVSCCVVKPLQWAYQALCCMTEPLKRHVKRHAIWQSPHGGIVRRCTVMCVYVCDADDELDRMRQQMAETASLLASAAYEQPQLQLHHYQAKLTEHLADPTQPLDLALEGAQGAEGQADEGQVQREEPSGERAGAQFNRLVGSPPRTPGQDALGRAARAKRVANLREVCCIACVVLPDSCHDSDDHHNGHGSVGVGDELIIVSISAC